MELTLKSQLSGKMNTMDLPIDEKRYWEFLYSGGLVQNIFPELSPEQREFIRSGITPQEWEKEFGKSVS